MRGQLQFWVACFAAWLVLGWTHAVRAETPTTAERMALLHAPQFNFTQDGEPLVHIGVLDGVDKVEFSSSKAFRVQRIGADQSTERFDGGRWSEVRKIHSLPGTYRHWVIVQRFEHGQDTQLHTTVDFWVDRGYLPQTIEVGGLFVIGDQRFDSRAQWVALGGFEDEISAVKLSKSLRKRFGVEATLHRELVTYPTGLLALRDNTRQITRPDIVWVQPTEDDQTFQLRTPQGERTYAGALVFTVSRTGNLSVVNVVNVETVVKGVVPSEVYASAPMESLKAQAVAARGEVISALGVRHVADPYLLCNSIHCQVYTGLTREHPRTNQAVDATRGQLMFFKEDWQSQWHIVDARYSANCGGSTEHKEHVWGGQEHSYLKGHVDMDADHAKKYAKGITQDTLKSWINSTPKAWCNTSRYGGQKSFRWTRSVSVDTLQEGLQKRSLDVGSIEGVKILKRGVSGRVTRMSIRGSKIDATLDSELAIRRAFGGLRSSMFTMRVDTKRDGSPKTFHFNGGGFGHGVGMCQTGAMMMAHDGKTYSEILRHYYQGISLKKVY